MPRTIALFRTADVLRFAIPLLTLTGTTTYLLSRPCPVYAKVTSFALTAILFVFLGLLIAARWLFRERVAFVSRHGIVVVPDGFPTLQVQFEAEIDRTLSIWAMRVPALASEKSLKGLVVVFRKPTGRCRSSVWLELLSPGAVEVDYLEPIDRSSLGHALGHVFFHWLVSQDGYHEFAIHRGLP